MSMQHFLYAFFAVTWPAQAQLTIERADPAYFELTVVEMRFSPDQPHLDVEATAT